MDFINPFTRIKDPPLFFVSRQLYHEALAYYFERTAVSIHLNPPSPRLAKTMILNDFHKVKKLNIHIGSDHRPPPSPRELTTLPEDSCKTCSRPKPKLLPPAPKDFIEGIQFVSDHIEQCQKEMKNFFDFIEIYSATTGLVRLKDVGVIDHVADLVSRDAQACDPDKREDIAKDISGHYKPVFDKLQAITGQTPSYKMKMRPKTHCHPITISSLSVLETTKKLGILA